jgi:putative ABC transport system permease protein
LQIFGLVAFRNFRYGLRALLRVPSLTAISILTVALGIGTGTSLFSVVKAVLLNPLPYPEPDRLVWLAEVNDRGKQTQVAYRNFLDWSEQNHSFAALAAYENVPAILSGGDLPQSTHAGVVTDDFFNVMGVQARVGRTFSPAEQVRGAAPVAVIGYGLWQRAFGGSPDVIGRTLRIAGVAPTIVGILPPGFAWPEEAEIWLPKTIFGDPGVNVRTGHNWRVVGRLLPGVPIERAQAEISGIERRIKSEHPSPFQSKDAAVFSLQSHIVGEVRPALLMLFGAVGFLLLIVCVNVANLLLVRVTARSRELAVRTALGAGRRHLVRQMLAESLLLAVAGGAAGLLLATWSMGLLRVLLPAELPLLSEIQIDGGVVGFALAVSAAAGLLFGILPACRACGMNVNDALKSGSRTATAGRASHRTQAALVVSEVCLSLVLVAGAGLLARSFWNMQSVDPGFRPDHVLVSDASFPSTEMPEVVARYRELLGRIRAIPGVAAAGTTSNLPIAGPFHPDGHFYIEGRREQTKAADAGFSMVSPGYLSALRIPLLRGRDFTEADAESSQGVIIISQELAHAYFPGADPLGQRIWFDSFEPKEEWLAVVGIAADVRQDSMTQKSLYAQAYVCYTQQQIARLLSDGILVVRTKVDPGSLSGAVRNTIRSVNPESAPTPRTMESALTISLARQRFQMQILGTFAVLALLLAAVGLYGVLSYMVTANRAPIGIRLALGAQPSLVFRMITARALALAAAGALLGILGCLAIRRVLAAMLFGIGPTDPMTIAAAVAVLLAVTVAAAFFPARRAMRTDPMVALREE